VIPTDPRDLAARPAFAGLLARLRGGRETCRACSAGAPELVFRRPQFACKACSGSGRVAVPPDPRPDQVGALLRDWWEENGGDLAGLLWCYALGTPYTPGARLVRVPDVPPDDRYEGAWDGSVRPALAAWDEYACPARAAAVRGLRVERHSPHLWCLVGAGGRHHAYMTEPGARLALKRAALACYDPGNPYGPGVLVPMRAEGARLTVRHGPSGYGRLFTLTDDLLPASLGRPWVPSDLAYEYRLDGARVGAPPGWEWVPWRVACGECKGTGKWCRPKQCPTDMHRCGICGGSGERLAVTWEAWPSSLLPAADAGGRTSSGARHVRVDLEDLRR
jgi:hypothetical protein